MKQSVIVIGGGGHGKVVVDLFKSLNVEICGVFDDMLPVGTMVIDVPVLGKLSNLHEYTWPIRPRYVVAIGGNAVREQITTSVALSGLSPISAIHPRAWVSGAAKIGPGTVVFAQAAVGPGAVVGDGSIVNTGAIVEHDCQVGRFAHICPGARLGGAATIGHGCLIGTGAVVLPGLLVGDRAIVGAGAVVTKDVMPGETVVGVPATRMGKR